MFGVCSGNFLLQIENGENDCLDKNIHYSGAMFSSLEKWCRPVHLSWNHLHRVCIEQRSIGPFTDTRSNRFAICKFWASAKPCIPDYFSGHPMQDTELRMLRTSAKFSINIK